MEFNRAFVDAEVVCELLVQLFLLSLAAMDGLTTPNTNSRAIRDDK
jgi:hypothetical protein